MYIHHVTLHSKEDYGGVESKKQGNLIDLWCFIGDFNSTRNFNERKRESALYNGASQYREFNNFVLDVEIEEVPIMGRKFIGSNERAMSRLDKALVSKE